MTGYKFYLCKYLNPFGATNSSGFDGFSGLWSLSPEKENFAWKYQHALKPNGCFAFDSAVSMISD
jgi:hypothetical protein